MRLLKTHLSFPRPCGRVLERPARHSADPQGSHELEARQSAQVLRMPLPEGGVLRSFPYDRVLHNRVAKVLNNRRDGEDAAKSLVQTLLSHTNLQCEDPVPAPRRGREHGSAHLCLRKQTTKCICSRTAKRPGCPRRS